MSSTEYFDALWIYLVAERRTTAGSKSFVQQNSGDVYRGHWDHLGERGARKNKTIDDLGLRPVISFIRAREEAGYFHRKRKFFLAESGGRSTNVQKDMFLD